MCAWAHAATAQAAAGRVVASPKKGVPPRATSTPPVTLTPTLTATPQGELPKTALDGPLLVALCYHQFGDRREPGDPTYRLAPAGFQRQLDWLQRNHWTFVTVEQVAAHWTEGKPLPEKSVLLTFDDGFESIYTQAWPMMEKAGIPGALFLYTDFIKWQGGALKWDQLKKMGGKGMSFQSHSMSHPNLARLRDGMGDAKLKARLRSEMEGSRDFLRTKLGVSPVAMAYPYGVYNAWVLVATRDAGYKLGFTVDPGPNDRTINAYKLKRHLVTSGTHPAKFAEFFNKRVLHLVDHSPAPGSHLSTRDVTVKARILDDVDPASVVLKLGDKPLKGFQYDPVTRVITRKAKMPIFRGGHLLTVQAVDRNGVARTQSWYFRVRQPAAKSRGKNATP